jgi:hypothetical protein
MLGRSVLAFALLGEGNRGIESCSPGYWQIGYILQCWREPSRMAFERWDGSPEESYRSGTPRDLGIAWGPREFPGK